MRTIIFLSALAIVGAINKEYGHSHITGFFIVVMIAFVWDMIDEISKRT